MHSWSHRIAYNLPSYFTLKVLYCYTYDATIDGTYWKHSAFIWHSIIFGIQIEEQVLNPQDRSGYTAAEWGVKKLN